MRWHGWAEDTFRNGGALVDTEKWYAARDKVTHIVGAALLWCLLALLPLPFGLRLALFEVVAFGVELIEWYRFDRWAASGALSPWPVFADRPSWRDLVADHLGFGLAAVYLALLR